MKYLCTFIASIIYLTFGFTLNLHSAEKSLSFHLVQSEYKLDDILKSGVDVDKEEYEVFTNDNVVYVVSRIPQLDDKDFQCNEMLDNSHCPRGFADSTGNSYQTKISFNTNGRDKLERLAKNYIGRRLAILFQGKMLATPLINDFITVGEMFVSGLSYDDARHLRAAIDTVCAVQSYVSFRMVHPYQEKTYELPESEIGIDKSKYECFAKGKLDYWVSKKVELDNKDFEHAKIFVTALLPSTGQPEEIELESIPWQFNEEDRAAQDVRGLRVRITLNNDGRRKLEKLSENNVGRELAVIFEKRLLMVEPILGKITSKVVAVGSLTYIEAKRLRDTINRQSEHGGSH